MFFIEKFHLILRSFFPSSNLTLNSISKNPPPGDLLFLGSPLAGTNFGTFLQLLQYGAPTRTFPSRVQYGAPTRTFPYYPCAVFAIFSDLETTNITYADKIEPLETKYNLENSLETKNIRTNNIPRPLEARGQLCVQLLQRRPLHHLSNCSGS